MVLIPSCSGSIAAGFGVAVGTGALFIFGEVPRVRNDILRQLPFFDTYYDRTIPPEDNVSWSLFSTWEYTMLTYSFSPSKLSRVDIKLSIFGSI